MRKLILVGLVLLSSCNLLKKKEDADAAADAAAEAAAPTAVEDAGAAPVAVTAKNVADVARFPAGETAVADDDSKLAQLTPARTAPKGGNVVAMLKAGGDVTKIAEYQGSYLVTFPDPKDASATLMGWIGKEAFTAVIVRKTDAGPAVVDAGPPSNVKITCPAGAAAVVLTAAPICKKKCTKDTDCKTTTAGSCANANSQAGTVVRVCVND